MRKCATEGCLNKGSSRRRFCLKCNQLKYRKHYPLKYWYSTLKMNAKRRGKSFSLTLEQFSEFCYKTGYGELKGKTATSLSIDRIRPLEGYQYDNIRAITLSDNTRCQYDPTYEPDVYCPF
jgi:hypothetical protein